MVKDENNDFAKDNTKKKFESLAMIVGESAREYAKGLARAVKYYGIEVPNETFNPALHFVRKGLSLRVVSSLPELEQALVNGEELRKQVYETGGHVLTASFRTRSGQGE